jgi:hypothetical protein
VAAAVIDAAGVAAGIDAAGVAAIDANLDKGESVTRPYFWLW